jgi:hypothetical protein
MAFRKIHGQQALYDPLEFAHTKEMWRVILFVESREASVDTLRNVAGAELKVVRYAEIGRELLHEAQPDVVIAPLMTQGFDVLDLACVLNDCGYRGALRAIAPKLPDPHLIRREVIAICPKLDFDFFEATPH